MAKLFPIGIEVEEVAVGSVLRILNKTPGVAKLHLNLLNEGPVLDSEEAGDTTNEVRAALPPIRRPKESSAQMVVAQVLKVTPAHNTVLREALKRAGFSTSSLPSLITKMREIGTIKRVGVGTWRLTDKGLRHYGIADTKALPRKTHQNGPPTNNANGVRKLVLTSLSEKDLLAKELSRVLKDHEYSPKNMTGTVGKMRKEGLVKSSGGVYSLTDHGRAVLNEVVGKPMENALES